MQLCGLGEDSDFDDNYNHLVTPETHKICDSDSDSVNDGDEKEADTC
jgi:hypothetical protein